MGSVAPPVRIYTNRILNFLRTMPKDGLVPIPNEVREDIEFFKFLMPHFNGISVLDKSLVPCTQQFEIDSCFTGCGVLSGDEFYSCIFPQNVLEAQHTIAHHVFRVAGTETND